MEHISGLDRLMIALRMSVIGNSNKHGVEYDQRSARSARDRLRVQYDTACFKPDPFSDINSLDTADEDLYNEVCVAVKQMLKDALYDIVAAEHWSQLGEFVRAYIDVFHVSFSSVGPVGITRQVGSYWSYRSLETHRYHSIFVPNTKKDG